MSEKVIILNWQEIPLLELTYINETYYQKIYIDNLKSALSTGCPIEFLFNNKIESTISSKNLPIIFDEFNFSDSRTDLISTYKITPNDSVFEKLYKIAIQNHRLSHDEFWLSVKN